MKTPSKVSLISSVYLCDHVTSIVVSGEVLDGWEAPIYLYYYKTLPVCVYVENRLQNYLIKSESLGVKLLYVSIDHFVM